VIESRVLLEFESNNKIIINSTTVLYSLLYRMLKEM